MNPHTPPPTDEDLAREERELAALYRRLPKAEPDAALDARVLAEADRAIARPARRRSPPWLIGLGSAAALVLVAGIIWRMQPTLLESNLPPMTPDAPAAESKPSEPTARAPAKVSVPAPLLQDAVPAQPAPPAGAGAGATRSAAPSAEPEHERAAEKSAADEASSKPRAKSIDTERARREAGPHELPRANLDTAPLTQPAPPPRPALAPPPAPAAPPLPPPALTATPTETTDAATATGNTNAPRGIEALVDAAREALRNGDEDAARRHVRALLRDHPQFTLPDDLAALAPSREEGPP